MGVRISLPVHRPPDPDSYWEWRPKRENKMSKIRTYFEETTQELVQKTSWPTWQELQGSAMVVLTASCMIALVVLGMDTAFKKLMELAYQLLNNM